MPWATNPLFKPASARSATDVEAAPSAAAAEPIAGAEAEAAPTDDANSSRSTRQEITDQVVEYEFKEPTTKFTAHQIFYIFILDGIGAMIVSGGINFAIAYGKLSYLIKFY